MPKIAGIAPGGGNLVAETAAGIKAEIGRFLATFFACGYSFDYIVPDKAAFEF
jgi:hypothetical protein